jgi:DNA-nicking Smr family endonuclease
MDNDEKEGTEAWRKLMQLCKALAPSRHAPIDKPKVRFKPRRGGSIPISMSFALGGRERMSPVPLPLVTERRLLRTLHGADRVPFTVDLHHYYQQEAAIFLQKELRRALQNQHPWALVITGKGRAEQEGVLRKHWKSWLEEDEGLRPYIRGYAPAGPAHGGGGAFYVLLRKL